MDIFTGYRNETVPVTRSCIDLEQTLYGLKECLTNDQLRDICNKALLLPEGEIKKNVLAFLGS